MSHSKLILQQHRDRDFFIGKVAKWGKSGLKFNGGGGGGGGWALYPFSIATLTSHLGGGGDITNGHLHMPPW